MKKSYFVIILFLSILLITATAGVLQAAVSGPCSECHTMHNSQNGDPMVVPSSTTPNEFLARGSCLGCHGETGIVVGNAPNVFGDPNSTMTAGGTFKTAYVDTDPNDYMKVHNVIDIAWTNDEAELTAPPGATATTLGDGITNVNFTCAGLRGCHGDHDSANTDSAKGIRGFHHGSNAYRYCQTAAATPVLIGGQGSSDWEEGGATATNHNIYSANSSSGISKFCAECHGDYHGTGNTNTSSPFKRHPTDNLLSAASGWTMASVTVDYNRNPFAFQDPNTGLSTTSVYTTTGARVACVSCHRAHGTPVNDILRFDYDDQQAGGGETSGCLGCHHRQR